MQCIRSGLICGYAILFPLGDLLVDLHCTDGVRVGESRVVDVVFAVVLKRVYVRYRYVGRHVVCHCDVRRQHAQHDKTDDAGGQEVHRPLIAMISS